MSNRNTLPFFLSFADLPLPWQMSASEKAAFLLLVREAAPEVALEIGTYQGGSLQVLSANSQVVHSIDIDPYVKDRLGPRFPNVAFHTGNSDEVLPALLQRLHEQGSDLGFVLIDGDHSTEGVKSDINHVLKYRPRRPVYVLFHDSFNPDCRQGILEADWQQCPHVHFVEIDFVPGEFFAKAVDTAQAGSMWGGFALAILLPEKRTGSLSINQSRRGLFEAAYARSCHRWERSPLRRVLSRIKHKLVG
jgi:hypothetical protein